MNMNVKEHVPVHGLNTNFFETYGDFRAEVDL